MFVDSVFVLNCSIFLFRLERMHLSFPVTRIHEEDYGIPLNILILYSYVPQLISFHNTKFILTCIINSYFGIVLFIFSLGCNYVYATIAFKDFN